MSFYVDDGLTGANSVLEAVTFQKELQELFTQGRLLLCKWRSNKSAALRHLPSHLIDQHPCQDFPVAAKFTKVLKVEMSTDLDFFHLTTSSLPYAPVLTKRVLLSDNVRVFDVLR